MLPSIFSIDLHFFTCFSSSDQLHATTLESSNMSDPQDATTASPKKKRQRKWHRKFRSQPVRADSPPVQPHQIKLSQQNYAAISSDSSEGIRFGRLRRSCGVLSQDDDLTQPEENITQPQSDSNISNLPELENIENNCLEPQPQETSTPINSNISTNVNNDSGETTNSVEIPNAQAQKYNEIPHTQSSNPEMEDTYVDYRVTHVQGGGDTEQPQRSINGLYSLVANTLKLSTV